MKSRSRRPLSIRVSPLVVAGLAGALLVGACSPSTTPTPSTTPAASSQAAGTPSGDPSKILSASQFTITDPWVKATDGKMDMTAVFGTLKNLTGEELHLVSATTTASKRTELHEMVKADGGAPKMAQMPNGLVIPAKGEAKLMPGGNHIMIMEMPAMLEAGVEVKVTLTFKDGRTFSFTAPARTFDGANEEYVGGHGMKHGSDKPGSGKPSHSMEKPSHSMGGDK